ncbi:MAG: aldo/keto reductase [Pyrinomonadaceae bacterium]|nr:aldo/keto reductase [Sphingobacteriaceae bacterium]
MKIELSRLGFGLSSIAGSGNFAHQEKLIKTAIDCGITHFDVAPYYGSGDAEKILGDILSTCKDQVTITTKFGLMPLAAGRGGSLLRSALRPVFRRMRFLKHIASSMVSKAHQPKTFSFEKGALETSINASIKKLGRPADIFLLHDAEIDLAQNPDLTEELYKVKEAGKTRLTGISGTADMVLQIFNWNPQLYEVAQLENSLTSSAPIEALERGGADVINHRAIQGGLSQILFLLQNRPTFKEIWLREVGVDLHDKESIANILIELALYENRAGTILFSTTNPDRIKKIARVLASPQLGMEGCLTVRSIFSDVYVDSLKML